MKIIILKCRDCGAELNRSNPLSESDVAKAMITSGLAAGTCPKGCRSTFSDLNLNTKAEVVSHAIIFQLNDYEWWIGPSLEACVKQALEDWKLTAEDGLEDPHELTDEELDRLIFEDDDGTDERPNSKRTFRAELDIRMAAGKVGPCIFAGTE